MPTRWTRADTELLLNRGCVSHKSRRSNQRMQTKYKMRQPRAPRVAWTTAQIATLRDLHAQGLSAREICNRGVLPQSQMAVQKQLGRLGLTNRRSIVKFSPAIREQFREFLREHWQGRTPDELRDLWNQATPNYPTNVRRVIAYLMALKLKIPYGEVQRIKASRRREQKIKRVYVTAPDVLLGKLRSNRAAVMRARIERGRDIWSGLTLPEQELTANTGDVPDDAE